MMVIGILGMGQPPPTFQFYVIFNLELIFNFLLSSITLFFSISNIYNVAMNIENNNLIFNII